MEDYEKKSFIKSKRHIKNKKSEKLSIIHLIKRQFTKIKNPKINISLIFIFLLLFTFLIFLFFENKKLKIKLNKFKYEDINILENSNNNILNYTEKNKNIVKNLFGYKIDKYKNNDLNQIHISYSLDNYLIYPTFVSMVSGLENNKNNIIIYHLLLSFDFNRINIDIFESLKTYKNVKINYYIIPKIFLNLKSWTNGTDCVYYKILLPIMFPNLKRMIYLDGDTLIRKDISEMYNYPFNDNYILGFPFYMASALDKYGIRSEHYINGGCLLFNIKKIKKDFKDFDLLHFTFRNNGGLRFREQDSINYVFYPKIGFLPLKYGIYMIGNKKIFNLIAKYTRSPLNLTEGYEAIYDPAIVHFSCCWPKVWNKATKNLFKDKKICKKYQKEFYNYAKKTKYYSVIYNTLFLQKIETRKRKARKKIKYL